MYLNANVSRAIKIFLSYSYEDKDLLRTLLKHLDSLTHNNLIECWYIDRVDPGSDWKQAVTDYLRKADIILLLISSDFVASEICNNIDIKIAMERYEKEKVHVVPVILRPVEWEDLPCGKLQCLPTDARPITLWQNMDAAFSNIVQGIKRVLSHLTTSSQDAEVNVTSLIWNIPHRKNPFFTGREEILDLLQSTFVSSEATTQDQVLSGLGGAGKTQIAIEYAYRSYERYQAILWVRADSQEDMIADFVALADLLELPERTESNQQRVILAIRRWLQKHTKWLLILDNVENVNVVQNLIPPVHRGHILITTRLDATGPFAHTIRVQKMDSTEGALLLLRRSKLIHVNGSLSDTLDPTVALGKDISGVLDGLPLALDQAGAYIDETKAGLSDYLDMYKNQSKRLLYRRGSITLDHPESVGTTFALSFEKIQQTNALSADLLCLFAFLQPDAIPEEIFIGNGLERNSSHPVRNLDPFEANLAIEELLKFSLIQRDSNAKVISIHRLLQTVLRDGMFEDQQRLWAERAVQATNLVFPDIEFASWSLCQRYLLQAQFCADLINQWNLRSKEAENLLNKLGDYLYERANYSEAEIVLKQSLAICEDVLEPDDPDTARNLDSLAELYRLVGRYVEAEPLYKRALLIREQKLGPDHPDTSVCLNNLGLLYATQGRFIEAEPLYQRALAIREQALGPTHIRTARTLNNLALLYGAQGRYAEAESLYLRSLAIREEVSGPNHPDTARCLNNLVFLYTREGKYDEAEPLCQRALTIREQALGPEHPGTAQSLNNLAELYRKQGRYIEAEPLCQRALAIREQVLGPNHVATAFCLATLAGLYRMQGRYAKAEPLYQRALGIRERALETNHPDIASTLEDITELYQAQGKYAEAISFCQRALDILQRISEPDHSNLVALQEKYQMLLQAQKEAGNENFNS